MRVFGCAAWVHVPKQKRSKLDSKSEKGILLSCLDNGHYKVWLRNTGTVVISKDVFFNEYEYPAKLWFQSDYDSDEEIQARPHEGENDNPASGDPGLPSMEIDALTYHPGNNTSNANTNHSLRDAHTSGTEDIRADTTRHYPDRVRKQVSFWESGTANVATNQHLFEPSSIKEALSMSDSDRWIAAIPSELESLHKHNTWNVCARKPDMKVLPTRFVFKTKLTDDGRIGQYKARLVVKGFMQENVPETYAPVVDFSSVRVALTVAIQKGFCIHQIDIRTAFLHGDTKDTVYISPPPGVAQIDESICKSSEVLRLQKV